MPKGTLCSCRHEGKHLQRSGDVMSVSADRAWIGGPITDSGDPTQLGMGAG
jgi:hypothetical protein